jgi:hypothetical protein
MKTSLVAMVLLLILALTVPGATAEGQAPPAQAPERALANLYAVAKSIIGDPAGEAEEHPGGSPTFPYPDAIQLQWDASMSEYGNKLNAQEQALFPPCATHLNNAIADMEKGYTTADTQPKSNTGAQESAQQSYAAAKAEFAQCDAAYALAQSEIGTAPANKPQQGGADTSASPESPPAETPPAAAPEPAPENPPAMTPETPASDTAPPSDANAPSKGPVAGSVEESEEPGSIDWTPTLDPLSTYLAKEWKKTVNDPKNKDWAPDDAANTLTLTLRPNQVPEVESITGPRSSSLRTIMENGNLPVVKFPDGSKLSSVRIAPIFRVRPTSVQNRTRMKYYERGGIFKSYQVAQ